jgi:hypothetical protein
MWFLPNVTKKPIPDLVYKCQQRHEEYVKLADKLIEQHPLFARMVADRFNEFDKYKWMPVNHEPITSKETSYVNRVMWTNAPVVFPMGI